MLSPLSPFLRCVALSVWLVIVAVGLLLGSAIPTRAHEGGFPFRYVGPDGVDAGECHDPAAACATILYAINQALPGEQIRVAAGTYFVANTDVLHLLSEIIPVRGGYSPDDAFTAQKPTDNPTYLLGLSPQYADLLAINGFRLIQDAKAARLSAQSPPLTLKSAANSPATFTPCTQGFAGEYACQGIDLLARIPLEEFSSTPFAANDIWGYVDLDDKREYALIGLRNGMAVVNVTDPLNPAEVGTIPGLSAVWRDIKVYQFFNQAQNRWDAYAYVVTDGVSQGLQIVDLSDLPNSISLTHTYTGSLQVHNIYLGNVDYTTGLTQSGSSPHAYLLGADILSTSGGVRILDLADPLAPVEVAAPTTAQYVHDATSLVITDSRTVDCHMGHNPCELYIDFNVDTVDIWDVTDKSALHKISSTPYAGSRYGHSGWWSADKMFIFFHDEIDEQAFNHNTRLRTLDISDLTTPFVSRVWDGPTPAIDHNGFTKATHYYMSNYRRGLTILDVSDPNNPKDITFFDTFPSSDSAHYSGAWGVYPYLPSGTILVSDIERGLFILREQGLAITASGPSSVQPGQPISYTLTVVNNGFLPATNLIISNTLPAGGAYLAGGALVGDSVSWTMANLAPGVTLQVTFTITAPDQTLVTNDSYRVQATGSIAPNSPINVTGDQAIVTQVGYATTYLPLIWKN